MTQLSRPFQLALAAMGLFVVVWFVALRGHSSSSGSSIPSAASSPASKPAASPSTYHGSAPGVAGLTSDIAKARGAVQASQRNAKQLEKKSAQVSGSSAAAATAGGTAAAATPSAAAPAKHSSAAASAPSAHKGGTAHRSKASSTPPLQRRVEHQLKQGKVAAILFWNPAGAVDQTVRSELQAAAGALGGKLAVNVARPGRVGAFGSFTRTIQVYSTPTILLVNRHGQTSTVLGLTDAFSLRQAVAEAK